MEMYKINAILCIIGGIADAASYQSYDQYPTQSYPTYTTKSNIYPPGNQYPYKVGAYSGDILQFPEVTRYPNYASEYSTTGYNTQRSNVFYPPGHSSDINSRGYAQGYSSYEVPFISDIREYCVNRSPQNGIWIEMLMGMWYGVEFVQHLAGDARVDYAKTCIVIHIAEPVDQVCFVVSFPSHSAYYINGTVNHKQLLSSRY